MAMVPCHFGAKGSREVKPWGVGASICAHANVTAASKELGKLGFLALGLVYWAGAFE